MFKQTSLILITLMLTTQAASADWFVQPKYGKENRSYELNIGNDIDADADINGVVLGISFIHSSGWYIDFEKSSGEDLVGDFYPSDEFIKVSSQTLSTGASLGNGFTVFGGYTATDTYIANLISRQYGFEPEDFQFVTSGLFGGLAKSFNFAEDHSLTISAALGAMIGEYQATSSTFLGTEDLDAEGEATGYSANITYTYRLSPKAALSFGVKQQAYTYTGMTGVDKLSGLTTEYVDTEENMLTKFVKASYTF